MKHVLHKADTRGQAEHGWLHSFHTFSFAGYHNPKRNGFGKLRVLNDDVVQPGQGFATHPHANMEIISIPLSGCLRHKDSMGNTQIIPAGEVQVMSAGTGITHSEYNHSDINIVNFLQIWILPKNKNIKPGYDQSIFPPEDRKNRFQSIVVPDSVKDAEGALSINQDAWLSLADIEKGKRLTYSLHSPGNGVYVFILDGLIEAADEALEPRDALGVSGVESLPLHALENAQVLCIEVPM
jgi:quercetin 2,3-dioxygenase